MSKRFNTGFVVGKFCPLHAGHELVINTALEQCERVIVLTYTSEEYYPAAHRRLWLNKIFPTVIVLAPEDGYPDDDATGSMHRDYCAELMESLGYDVDVVFGSESYIHDLARRFSYGSIKYVQAVMVDEDRLKYPISGTDLRKYPSKKYFWCNPIIHMNIPKRILLIGGESTGKSTLAEALAKAIPKWGKVDEYGREYGIHTNNTYSYQSLLEIAKEQVRVEESMMLAYPNSYLICDTSPLVTKFYSQKWYGSVDPMLNMLAQRTYDYVFFCMRDFPYAYEEGRSGPEFSEEQSRYYFSKINQPVTTIFGSVEQRVQTVLNTINRTEK